MDQGQVAKTFKDAKTKIITPLKTYDPDDEYDEEYFEFSLFMSRREYKAINRRIQRGRVASVKEGKWIASGSPFGYEKYKLHGEKGYSLRIVESQAAIVREIYELYAGPAHMSYYGIADLLTREGKESHTGGPWSRYSVRDILTNPVYCGKVRWGDKIEKKTYLEDGRIRKTKKRSDNAIIADGRHEPIISTDMYDKVQVLVNANKRIPVEHAKLQNPLTGLVYCKKCGRVMTRLSVNTHCKYPTLRCSNRYCNNVAAPLDLVEDAILQELERWCDKMEFNWPKDDAAEIKRSTGLSAELDRATKDVNSVKAQIDRTYSLLEQGVYTLEVFQERQAKLQARLLEKQKIQYRIEHDLREAIAFETKQGEFIPKVRTILGAYHEIESPADKNTVLHTCIDRVTYLKTERNHRGTRDNANFQLELFLRR